MPSFYDDLEFLHYAWLPKNRFLLRKRFEGYHLLAYLHKGAFKLSIGSKTRLIEGPTLWFGNPGPLYEWQLHNDKPFDHRYVAIQGNRIEAWIRGGLWPRGNGFPAYKITRAEAFRLRFQELHQILESHGNGARAVHALEALLIHWSEEQAGGSKLNLGMLSFGALLAQIDSEPLRAWDFKRFAQESGLSYSRFRSLFAERMKISPHRYLLRARMLRAADLLREEGRLVKEVAHLVGMDNPAYFARLFRKTLGVPPGDYQKEVGARDGGYFSMQRKNGFTKGTRRKISDIPWRVLDLSEK